jgi:surface antigen
MQEIIVTLALAVALAACAESAPSGESERPSGGTPSGAPAGTATVAAAPVGLVGSAIGAGLDHSDWAALEAATRAALESGPTDRALPWRNPDTGSYGTVMPLSSPKAGVEACRDFEQTVILAGQQRQASGRACRQLDGTWKMAPE